MPTATQGSRRLRGPLRRASIVRMCPTDSTPDPRDMERMPEEQQIPQAKREDAGKPRREDIARRPGLPEEPRHMPADDPGAQE